MTVQALLIGIIVFLSAVLTVAILIFTYLHGRKSVRDDPNKGLIFIKTGKSIAYPLKAKLSEIGKKGSSYIYKCTYGGSVVMLPKSYGEYYYHNKRMIFITHLGQLIASPFDTDIPLTEEESKSLIYELCSSHIGADGIRALKGKQSAIILIAIIAFAVGVVAMFGFNQFQTTMQNRQNTETQQQIQVPNQIPVEVK